MVVSLIRRIATYAWAGPNTLLGLAAGLAMLVFGAAACRIQLVFEEFQVIRGLPQWFFKAMHIFTQQVRNTFGQGDTQNPGFRNTRE